MFSVNERRALAAVAGLYLALVFYRAFSSLFIDIGRDYLSYWSVGVLAKTQGWEQAYNLDRLGEIELESTPQGELYLKAGTVYVPTPAPYLPVFLLPFLILAAFPPLPGFLVWSLVKIIGLWLYLLFFTKSLSLPRPKWVLVFLSYPFFVDLFWGQYSFVLLVIVGEFIRCLAREKERQAGLWLGFIWMKPPLFLLLLPLTVLKRQWRVLEGWFLSTALVWMVSALIAGRKGLGALLQLWQVSSRGLQSMGILGMMNLRALGLNLFGERYGPIFVFSLGGVFLLLVVWHWLSADVRKIEGISYYWLILAALTATFVITWHAHIHNLLAIYPLLLLLDRDENGIVFQLWRWLVFVFPLSETISMLLSVFEKVSSFSVGFLRYTRPWFVAFVFNLYAFLLATQTLNRHRDSRVTLFPIRHLTGGQLSLSSNEVHHGDGD